MCAACPGMPEQPHPTLPEDPEMAAAIADTQTQLATMMVTARKVMTARAVAMHPDLQPMAFKVLMTLSRTGPVHQSALARMLKTDKAVLSRLLKQLDALGMTSRTVDPEDGRAMLVDMTPAARKRYAETQQDAMQLLVDGLSQWDAAEVRRLADLLLRLNETTS